MIETTTATVRVWVGNLGDYNAGRLVGAWVDIDPAADLVRDTAWEIDRAANVRPSSEEWMVFDVEGVPAGLVREGSWEYVEELRRYVDALDEVGDWCADAYAALCNYRGEVVDADEFADVFCGEYDSIEEYAADFAEDMGWLAAMEKAGVSSSYFDVDAFANDLRCGGDVFMVDGYVFRGW
jgi:antirestriction protein